MTKGQYLGKLIKGLLIIGVPLLAIAWVSTSKASPNVKPITPKPADDVPGKIKAAVDAWLADDGGGGATVDGVPPPVHVAWFEYNGRWIDVQEYDDTASVEDDTNLLVGPLGRTYTYRARFRWVVMVDGSEFSLPLAVGDQTSEGSASSIGPSDEAIQEARLEAAQGAAQIAVDWIDAHNKGK
jgi:hypothetical protein